MPNLFRQFLDLIPDPSLQVGDVAAVSGNIATIALPGGGTITARGSTTVGARVFVRNGVIEGPAPTLTISLIEV